MSTQYLSLDGLKKVWAKNQKLRYKDINRWAAAVTGVNNVNFETNKITFTNDSSYTFYTFNGKSYTMSLSDTDNDIVLNMSSTSSDTVNLIAVVLTSRNKLAPDKFDGVTVQIITKETFDGSPTEYLILGEVVNSQLAAYGALYDANLEISQSDKLSSLQTDLNALQSAVIGYELTLDGNQFTVYSDPTDKTVSMTSYLYKTILSKRSSYMRDADIKVTSVYTPYSGVAGSAVTLTGVNGTYTDTDHGYGKETYVATTTYNGTTYTSATRAVYITRPMSIWFSTSLSSTLPASYFNTNSTCTAITSYSCNVEDTALPEAASESKHYLYVKVPSEWTVTQAKLTSKFGSSSYDMVLQTNTAVVDGVTKHTDSTYAIYRSSSPYFISVAGNTLTLSGTGSL